MSKIGEVRFDFEGESIAAREGETIASALLRSGVQVFSRAVKYHRARGPYCLSGRCSQCLVRVDGEPNVTACTAPARQGTKVERQNAFPSVELDVFAGIDWMYPRGLDHHAMFAGVPVVQHVVAKVAREMAGLGKLPDAARSSGASYLEHETDVLVVGGGMAGISAARAAAAAGVRVTLVDEQPALGGRLRTLPLPGDPAPGWAEDERLAFEGAGGNVLTGSFAFGLYRDEGLLVAIKAPGRRLIVARPRAVVVAAGASEPLPPFGNNDLPGVFAARGLARMIRLDGVVPGKSAVVAGDGAEVEPLAALLRTAGCEVVAITGLTKGPRGQLVRARGRSSVAGAVIAESSGQERKLRCDLIAVAPAPSAFFDLARQAGAHVAWRTSGGFAVVADAEGHTGVAGVFACGEVTGPCSAHEAIEQGTAAGKAAAAVVVGGGR